VAQTQSDNTGSNYLIKTMNRKQDEYLAQMVRLKDKKIFYAKNVKLSAIYPRECTSFFDQTQQTAALQRDAQLQQVCHFC